MAGCGKCHACGTTLRSVLDGEEWCVVCRAYRRYRSHGWSGAVADGDAKCPTSLQCPTCHGSKSVRLVPPPEKGGYPVGPAGVCGDRFHRLLCRLGLHDVYVAKTYITCYDLACRRCDWTDSDSILSI